MPAFSYAARASNGQTVTGTLEASDQNAAIRQLREKGLIPTTVSATTSAPTKAKKQKGKGGAPNLEDLCVMSQQMSVMIRAGLPLIEVLDILAEQTERITLRNALRQIERDVNAGSSFTEALEKHKHIFNQFYISMIRAGEASGMLDSILDQVANYLERIASLQRKIKSAVMYPATVSTVAIGITVFLLVKVVPVFEDIFESLGGDLPKPTQITLAMSRFIQSKWYLLLAIVIGTFFGIKYWYKTPHGRLVLDGFSLKAPIFGPLFLKSGIAKFTRTFGTLIRSGVNILYALDIVAKTAGNVVIENAVIKTKAAIQQGESITKPLIESGVFPAMVTRMIEVGERTGALEAMLTKIADFYEDQVNAMVAGLTSLIEPLLIVFLGVVVGFIVISMFMPMFKMIELVSKKG
ncbi:MAG: type II secretion system F family protein [Candidatus Sumerlaeia bacterium]|nr:type II secretion system F family protein [Candidatus Sumerlaeia bacterium]